MKREEREKGKEERKGLRARVAVCISASLFIGSFAFAQSDEQFLGNIFNGVPDPIFDQYWDQVTPENVGKWGVVEHLRDTMVWDPLDTMFAYAEEQGFPVKQHTLVWGQQEPRWVADLSPEEQRVELEQWMTMFAERYPSVEMIDVVNEAQHFPPSFKDAIGGDGETGWDWVIWSFEKARELFPNSKLLINDYNILCCESDLEVYKEQIAILQERDLIDGIGVQAHGLEEVSPEQIQAHLDSLAEFGLPIYVSELELRGSDDQLQLNLYQDIFPVLWEHPSVEGVTLWGYKPGEMWRGTAKLIGWLDEDRPALEWLMEYTASNPGTGSAEDTTTDTATDSQTDATTDTVTDTATDAETGGN